MKEAPKRANKQPDENQSDEVQHESLLSLSRVEASCTQTTRHNRATVFRPGPSPSVARYLHTDGTAVAQKRGPPTVAARRIRALIAAPSGAVQRCRHVIWPAVSARSEDNHQ